MKSSLEGPVDGHAAMVFTEGVAVKDEGPETASAISGPFSSEE
jgi:hypothetical protein